MFEFYQNRLCVEAGWLVDDAEIMSYDNYKKLAIRNRIKIARRGCKNTPALVYYDSIPERFKEIIIEHYGDPYDETRYSHFETQIQPDPEAVRFFSEFRLQDGRNLPRHKQREYCTNAEILNAIIRTVSDMKAKRRSLGGTNRRLWESAAEMVNGLSKIKHPHSLPGNPRSLHRKVVQFQEEGLESLIHRGFCHNNSRKVTEQIERMIMSLYAMPQKPYSSTVHEMYLEFLEGKIEVYDSRTGELFRKEDFLDKKGKPVTISEATIWNYCNNPKNRSLVDSFRNGRHDYQGMHRPHHHRHKPDYALSLISMDDRDLPRKLKDGGRVKGYYAYDVASGCIIGASYSRSKDADLFINCMRDSFRYLTRYNLGMPMEVEVERHLVSNFKDRLMRAGIVFPFVRWCAAGNSQEKHAEHFNRRKKYQYEKKYQTGIGRFYAKSEANRPKRDRDFAAEDKETFKEATYEFDYLVAEDMRINELYNNDLHHDQEKYQGLTRLEVLKTHANPQLAKYDPALLAMYIGEKTTTTIRRSQYVNVNYQKYQLSSIDDLGKLKPNNYKVDAYWLPSNEDMVYLYQGEVLISECERIITYNTSSAERTDQDMEAMNKQRQFVKSFDESIKKQRSETPRVAIMDNKGFDQDEFDQVPVHVPKNIEDQDDDDNYTIHYDPIDDL